MKCLICGTYLDTKISKRVVYTVPGSISDASVSACVAALDGRRKTADTDAGTCPECDGRGHVPECIHVAEVCDACDGTGTVHVFRGQLRRVCTQCAGDVLDTADRLRYGAAFPSIHCN